MERDKLYIKFSWLFFIIVILETSCSNKRQMKYPSEMITANNILLKNPDKALYLLDKLRKNITKQQNGTQMYYQLLLFRAQDMCYISHKSKTEIVKCIDYYKKNYDSDKLMTAYYCLGCYYRDQNNYPAATNAYQMALTLVAGSKDYSLIGRIYNQQSQICSVSNKYESLALDKQSVKYFKLAKDSITLANSLRDIAANYQIMNKNDLAIKYGLQAYNTSILTDNKDLIHAMENELANYYLSANNLYKAGYYLKKTKDHLYNIDNISFYYYNSGRYYKGIHQKDSAIYYFNKCIQQSKDLNLKYNSYCFLRDVYKNVNISMAFQCANKMSLLERQIQQTEHDKEVTQINAQYKFKRTQNRINLLEENNRKNIYIITFLGVILITIAFGMLYNIKTNKKKKNPKLKNILNVDNELIIWKEKGQKELNEKFNNSSIAKIVHEVAFKNTALTSSQWAEFEDTIEEIYTGFDDKIIKIYPQITILERHVCYLIKGDFSPAEISRLTNHSRSGISSIRGRLYSKITGEKGGPKDFDELLKKFP